MPFTSVAGGGFFVLASLLAKGLIALGHDVVALFAQEGPSVDLFRSALRRSRSTIRGGACACADRRA